MEGGVEGSKDFLAMYNGVGFQLNDLVAYAGDGTTMVVP
jgi:hypothetical protein